MEGLNSMRRNSDLRRLLVAVLAIVSFAAAACGGGSPIGYAVYQSLIRIERSDPLELYQLTIGGALVSVVPLMIVTAVLQRFWRAGLTEGSVKG
jgi:ABC-type maltose transport system permease subunit